MDQFKGAAGTFDRETYRFTLDRNNLTEAEFEANILPRHCAVAPSRCGRAVSSPQTPVTEALYAWVGERRGFSMLRLTEADLTAPVAGTDRSRTEGLSRARTSLPFHETRSQAHHLCRTSARDHRQGPACRRDGATQDLR
jgi:hypothetical protein